MEKQSVDERKGYPMFQRKLKKVIRRNGAQAFLNKEGNNVQAVRDKAQTNADADEARYDNSKGTRGESSSRIRSRNKQS